MTREQAIEVLINRYNSGVIRSRTNDDEWRLATDTALTALREALKRRQGCEYCEKEKRIKNACYTNAFAEIYKYSKSFAVHMPLNFGSADCDFFINYCPMCGRKLEEEG